MELIIVNSTLQSLEKKQKFAKPRPQIEAKKEDVTIKTLISVLF